MNFINQLYDNFISYKYGFTPDIIVRTNKEQDLKKIINLALSKNIEFTYKMGAIKKLDNINFNKDSYKSLSMDISLMGLYFDKKIYAMVNNNKCLIVDIKNINKNWIFYLDECEIKAKNINIQTKYGDIPFKMRKKRNIFKLRTKNLSNEKSIILYKYLVEIINNFDNINHIGIKPPATIHSKTSNILHTKRRILRDYLGLIFNKNPSFIPSLVSQDIYKQVSWLKRENIFIDINASEFNKKLYIYNEFFNAMREHIILFRFDEQIFKDDYEQFIYFYSYNPKLLELLKNSFPNMDIKTKNEILGDNQENTFLIKASINFLGFFLYFIALLISIMSLSKFYKKFHKNLFLVKSFNYSIYIYALYLFILIILSYIIAYLCFYFTNEMINDYMKSYFYPIIELEFDYMQKGFMLLGVLLMIILFETKELKDLKYE